jgi:hypothetical protein
MDSQKPPTSRYRDPLNIMRVRSDSKSDALELLGWLNPLTLVALVATGIAKLFTRLFGGSRR